MSDAKIARRRLLLGSVGGAIVFVAAGRGRREQETVPPRREDARTVSVVEEKRPPPLPYILVTPGGPTDGGQYGPNTIVDGIATTTVGIQEAVDAALANASYPAREVRIAAGTYLLRNNVRWSGSSVTISGEGDATQIHVADGVTAFTLDGWSPFEAAGPNQTTFKDFTLTYGGAGFTAPGTGILCRSVFEVVLQNIRTFHFADAGLRFMDCAGVLLTNVYAEGGSGNGFQFDGSRNILATNCYSDTNNVNFLLQSSAATNDACYKSEFVNCYSTVAADNGWSIFNTKDTSFTNCLSDGSGSYGWQVSDSFRLTFNACSGIGNTKDNMKIAPRAISMADCGIEIDGGSYIDTVDGNNISLYAQGRLPISDVTIRGVKCYNAGTGGTGTWDGIRLNGDGTEGATVSHVHILGGCKLRNRAGSTASQRYAINLDAYGVSYVYVKDNYISPNLGPTAIANIQNCFLVADNDGFNPIGVVPTPVSGTSISPGGTTSGFSSGTTYTWATTPGKLSVTSGTGVSITIKDKDGKTIAQGMAVLNAQPMAVGEQFTATWTAAPTVVVAFS